MTTLTSNTLALGPGALSSDSLVKAGLGIILLIVFAESGLLIGFFLPGDSVLFTLGMLIARNEVSTPLPVAMILIGIAAVAGDQVGYIIGRKAGPALFRRPDSRLFRQEYVEQAHEFFEKHGPRSIILARFVPIVRTFTPVVAGVSRMNYRLFVLNNIVGGLLWGCGVTVLGYYLGKIDFVRNNIEPLLILIALVSVLPIVIEVLRNRRKRKRAGGSASSGSASSGAAGRASTDFDRPTGRGAAGWPGEQAAWSAGGGLPSQGGPWDGRMGQGDRPGPEGFGGEAQPGRGPTDPGSPGHGYSGAGAGNGGFGPDGRGHGDPGQGDPGLSDPSSTAQLHRGGGRHSAARQRQPTRPD